MPTADPLGATSTWPAPNLVLRPAGWETADPDPDPRQALGEEPLIRLGELLTTQLPAHGRAERCGVLWQAGAAGDAWLRRVILAAHPESVLANAAGAVTLWTGAYGLALFTDPERNDR